MIRRPRWPRGSDGSTATGSATRRRLLGAGATALASALAGCGGGDGDDATTIDDGGTTATADGTTTAPQATSTAAGTSSAAPTTVAPPETGPLSTALATSPSSALAPTAGYADADWLDRAADELAVERVTTLEPAGEGSLRAALAATGPRVVVFEVGGTIDLREADPLEIASGRCYVAGQTAPRPGVTIVGNGMTVAAGDVALQHLRVRPGTAAPDGTRGIFVATNVQNVLIDHCSVSWAPAANVRIDGGRNGRRVTLSNSLVAESLIDQPGDVTRESLGVIVNESEDEACVLGNALVHNEERNPRLLSGVEGIVVNNLVYDFVRAIVAGTGRSGDVKASLVGNRFVATDKTVEREPILVAHGPSAVRLFADGNVVEPDTIPLSNPSDPDLEVVDESPAWPRGLAGFPAADLDDHLAAAVGARPAQRSPQDSRIVGDVGSRTARRVADEADVGGYPISGPVERSLEVPATDALGPWLLEHARAVERLDG